MSLVPVTEAVRLSPPSKACESVEEHGLDPDRYIAVIEGECGIAGRVNLNNRLYPVEEAVPGHEKLCREAKGTFHEVHLGHQPTAETWEIALRFIGGSHRVEPDGSVVMEGLFAVPKTDLGQRVHLLWQEGVDIGVSSKGMARFEEHVIDKSSPFYKANPSRVGEKVMVMRDFVHEGYDIVRVPSAGTSLSSPKAQEALQRLTEAVERGKNMEPKIENIASLDDLKKADESVAEKIVIEARADLFTEEQVNEKIAEAVKDAEAKAREAQEKVKEAELQGAGKDEAVQKLTEQVKALEARNERADLRVKVGRAITEALAGKPASKVIESQVMTEFDEGSYASVEEAQKAAERKLALVEQAGVVPASKPSNPDNASPAQESATDAPKPGEGKAGGEGEQVIENAERKVASIFG